MKKILVSLLLGLSLVGCGKEEVKEVKEVKYEKQPGVEYTVENLEKFLEEDFLLTLCGEFPSDGTREIAQGSLEYVSICLDENEGKIDEVLLEYANEYIDIALYENEGKISEPLLEYANEYKEACVDLMNAKDYIEIRGILTELEYRALDYEYTK